MKFSLHSDFSIAIGSKLQWKKAENFQIRLIKKKNQQSTSRDMINWWLKGATKRLFQGIKATLQNWFKLV